MENVFTIGNIKRFARQAMRGKWVRAMLVMLIVAVVQNAPSIILSYFTSSDVVAYILSIYGIVIGGMMFMGASVFFLDCFRGTDEPGIGSFRRGLSMALKAIQLYIICVVLIFLWSLLFVIPGIIAAIRYSQSFFILADNPELSPFECIKRSKYMMLRLKGYYFLLQLSFIGWIILANIPSAIALNNELDMTGLATFEAAEEALLRASGAPSVMLLGLLVYFVLAYMLAANACFYDMISGNLKLYTEVPYNSETQGMY